MRKPQIITHAGEMNTEFTPYCPKCMGPLIVKEALGPADFDEHGWFHRQNFRCQDPKCNHTWSERIVVAGGGTLFKHG
jgi:transposase-like protein